MIYVRELFFSDDGLDKLEVIDEILQKYGNWSAENLVNLSHKKGSPWSMWDRKTKDYEITDKLILECYS